MRQLALLPEQPKPTLWSRTLSLSKGLEILNSFCYPVVLRMDVSSYSKVTQRKYLGSTHKNSLNEDNECASQGETFILDATGKLYYVQRWEVIPYFKGGPGWLERLIGNICVTPIIEDIDQLNLNAFKKKLKKIYQERSWYDEDSDPIEEVWPEIDSATSFLEGIHKLPDV